MQKFSVFVERTVFFFHEIEAETPEAAARATLALDLARQLDHKEQEALTELRFEVQRCEISDMIEEAESVIVAMQYDKTAVHFEKETVNGWLAEMVKGG